MRYRIAVPLPLLQILLICCLHLLSPRSLVEADDFSVQSPEKLFRRAASAWQESNAQNYQPFDELSVELLDLFHRDAVRNKLEVIGAMEESILILERFVFEQEQGRGDATRDRTLSKLYTAYATALSQLSPSQCQQLAKDPHTLLIGAETVKEASTAVCLENADNSARNAATLDATNQEAESLLAILNSKSVHERKPKEFVAELFDSFADSFDQKLLENLEYKVPALVGNLTKHMMHESYVNAMDAGSGTGLAGRYLRPLVKEKLVGVDASSKMLDIAAKCTVSKGCGLDDGSDSDINGNIDDRPLYDDLIVMDLEEMTVGDTLYRNGDRKKTTGFDLIVAADVLVYFGSLENLIRVFAIISEPGAVLVFSCEKAAKEEAPLGWRLLPSGRFAHTKDHAVAVAAKAGYGLKYYEDIVPRTEKGEPVKGHLFGFVLSTPEGAGEL